MIKASAPGKLFIAGEWAVLDTGNPAIVCAVDKRVFCELRDGAKIAISLDDFGIAGIGAEFDKQLLWKGAGEKDLKILKFCKATIDTVADYCGKMKSFHMRTYSDSMVSKHGKYGFGSSSAAVCAMAYCLLKLMGEKVDGHDGLMKVFKTACIAHYNAQGRVGSCADIAASVFGGVVAYRRFDPDWLIGRLEEGEKTRKLVASDWPGLTIEKLELPKDVDMAVSYSGKSSDTGGLIEGMKKFRNSSPDYDMLMREIKVVVEKLIADWKTKNFQAVLDGLNANHDLLKKLTEISSVNIATVELVSLAEMAQRHKAGAKLSGAGGGDCAIAFIMLPNLAKRVKKTWKSAGFEVVEAQISEKGVCED